MALRIYRQLQKKSYEFNSHESFFSLAKLDQTHRFYFSRIQSHLLENFLLHIGENFNWRERIHNSTSTGSNSTYLSIRLMDPETFSIKRINSTLTYMLWPSMRAVLLKKKNYESKMRTGMIKIKPLAYIKNRNKVLSKEERRKSNRVYKQLEKFFKKEYENSLDYFECKDDEVMKMLIRYIYYHNTKTVTFQKKTSKNDMQSLLENYEEPFMIYVENVMERTAAAVRIQQNWRKYLERKHQTAPIYDEMKKTRAILRIQRFCRDRVFYHRLSFQKSMVHELKLFQSNSFLLPHRLYRIINFIISPKNKTPLYSNLSLLCNPLKGAIWA